MRLNRLLLFHCLLLLLIRACSSSPPDLPPDNVSPLTPDTTNSIQGSSTTATTSTSGAGQVAGAMPAKAIIVPAELAPYAAALQPSFIEDLFQFRDATRYDIELSVASDLLHIQGTQRIRYTNRGGE